MVARSVAVNNIGLYAILLIINLILYIGIGLRLSFLCKKLDLKPPFPLGSFDKIKFFVFVNEMSKRPENSPLRLWVLLQNCLLVVIIILFALVFVKLRF